MEKTFNLGVIFPFSEKGRIAYATAYVGRDEVRRQHLLDGYDISLKFRDSFCNGRKGMQAVVEMWSEGIDGIIGDVCSSVCIPVGLLSAAWNLPQIGTFCGSELLSDKKVYPTFSRTVGTITSFIPVAVELMEKFGWNRIAIVVSNLAEVFETFGKKLKQSCEQKGYHVTYHVLEPILQGNKVVPSKLEIQQRIVESIKLQARVVFVFLYQQDTRHFLVSCYDAGLLNGDYAFFGMDTLKALDPLMIYRPELTSHMLHQGMMAIKFEDAAGPRWEKFVQDTYDVMHSGILDDIPDVKTPSISIQTGRHYFMQLSYNIITP